MYRLVFQKSVTVTGVNHGRHISCVSPDRVWISDWYNLILTNSTGHRLEQLKDVGCGWGVHTVNSDGDLIYIDSEHNINKLSTDNKDKTTLIKYNTAPWIPLCVYSSPTTGDLMVGMCDTDPWTGKVVRYNSSGENIHTIQHDKITAMGLYSLPIYITENRNGDVIVSDYYYGVVVTDRRGNYRFSYTGPPSGSGLWSHGICTDALSHILVCDDQTQSIHIINCNGEFLSQILSPQHGIDRPFGLCYYEKTHKLWVGSLNNNTANIYKVVHRDSLTGTHKMDEEGAISSPGESWIASLSKFGSDRPVIYGDSNRMDSGLGLSGIGIEESHEDLPDYSEESGGKRLKREKRELAEEKDILIVTSKVNMPQNVSVKDLT
ncbi:uncharacterized protein LOC134257996 [Saccostrea cucullata]|uniref:uncharacterized protein LOC134257996 n=1 Tax=Saccostrea cuccullata TaxID=36930 RepID=UPI002ED42EA4